MGLQDLIPTASTTSPLYPLTIEDPKRWKIPYDIEFHMSGAVNYVGGTADPRIDADAFKDIFQVSFELYLNETTELSDIVLPDACFLESLSFSIDKPARMAPVGSQWAYSLKQRVVYPLFERRQAAEVFLDIAGRLGILEDYYDVISGSLRKPYTLSPTQRYTWPEIVDRRYKSLFGPQHGLDWFEENGVITWPRKAEEIYWKPFVGGRTFVYAEYLKEVADQVERVIEENGIPRLDLTPFQPLPDWRPCRSHQEKRSEYDLFVVWRRDSLVAQRWTHQHPWLDETCEIDPYVYRVIINSDTAGKKGLKAEDWVELTSSTSGNSVRARVQLSEGIHPEVVCIPGGGGHWAKGLPVASQQDKGALFEWLVQFAFDQDIDPVSLNVDWCVRVKISKFEKERRA